MAKSLQDRLKQRRSSNFVGREQQLELFRQNLRRSLDSEDYYFIFSVHGQGGVGKTTLLKKYRSLAKEADALTAYTNEETKSIPEVLARFAQQLKEQDAELSDFDKRYKTYLQEKKRLEADPEAPKGAWQLGGRLIARSSKRLAKEFIPGSGLLLDGLDADAIGDQMGEWASFVKKRLTNKDEVQLLLQPVETLTPLFLEGLGKHAKNHRICLCFDTYEETDLYLDAWLRKLLEGQYGDAPENLLFVIAGREPLNPNAWSDYGDFIATIPLEAFSELEAKTYLERKGITDEAVVDSILGLSGRLPVLLATLAEAAKHATGDLTDPCATAVERFLKWIDDPVQRDLALHAALPRKLNQDIIQCLLPEGADAKALFLWLSAQPFVQKHQGGDWVYHSVVRELMLRHQFQLSRNTWSDLHSRLADLYDGRAEALGITEGEEQFSNEEWLVLALERTYHRLCAGYQRELSVAVADFVTIWRLNGLSTAADWAEAVAQSGRVWGNTELGELMIQGVQGFKAKKYDEVLPLFRHLAASFDWKEKHDGSWLYHVLGLLEADSENYAQAIENYQKAIQLNPEYADAYYNLGNALYRQGQLEQAIENYQKAIQLNPEYADAYYNLGIALSDHGQLAQAIENYQKAIQLDPGKVLAYNNLGNALCKQGQLKRAIQNYQKAIQLNPEYALAYYNLGIALSDHGQLAQAIENYQKAIQLNPEYADAYYNLGNALYRQGQLDQAIENYQKAIQLNPKYALAYNNLGNALSDHGQLAQAIENYQKAIQLDPGEVLAYNNLGNALCKQGQLKRAIQNYQKAIQLNPEDADAYYNLGYALSGQGQLKRAIQNYQKAIQLNPEDADAYYNLGYALSGQGQLERAIQNYQKAIQLNPEYAAAYNNLGIAYLTKGNLQNAQTTFQEGFKLDDKYAFLHMNYAHCLLAEQKQEEAMDHYCQSRNGFEDKSQFFQRLAADYTDLNLAQYNIPKTEYLTLIQQLKDEINYTE
jgi:tetratricopeptide (TPR) repeat protein